MELHGERNQHHRALQHLHLLQVEDQAEQILVELVQLLVVSRIRLVNRGLPITAPPLTHIRQNHNAVVVPVLQPLQPLQQQFLPLLKIALCEGEGLSVMRNAMQYGRNGSFFLEQVAGVPPRAEDRASRNVGVHHSKVPCMLQQIAKRTDHGGLLVFSLQPHDEGLEGIRVVNRPLLKPMVLAHME